MATAEKLIVITGVHFGTLIIIPNYGFPAGSWVSVLEKGDQHIEYKRHEMQVDSSPLEQLGQNPVSQVNGPLGLVWMCRGAFTVIFLGHDTSSVGQKIDRWKRTNAWPRKTRESFCHWRFATRHTWLTFRCPLRGPFFFNCSWALTSESPGFSYSNSRPVLAALFIGGFSDLEVSKASYGGPKLAEFSIRARESITADE